MLSIQTIVFSVEVLQKALESQGLVSIEEANSIVKVQLGQYQLLKAKLPLQNSNYRKMSEAYIIK